MTSKLAAGIKAIPQAQPYGLSMTASTPELPARAGALPVRLQDIARNYLGARRQSGVSLLEAARWLSEARVEAKHGEWAIFLEAIGLDESRARAQIRIHEEAQLSPMFADRIINGFLSEAVARELLPAPPDVREEVLTRETPPTLQDVRNVKRAATPDLPATQQPKIPDQPPAPFWQSLDVHHPTAHFWTRERPDLLRSACGMTIQNRLPSGSTEGGHCSSCVRAQWPQPPEEKPKIPEVAPEPPMITVQTNQGPREIAPTRTNGVLAWHTSITPGGRYAISHIPSGKRIAQFMYESRVSSAFDQLAALDWTQAAPDGGMSTAMAVQVARILVQFDDVDSHAARQAALTRHEARLALEEQGWAFLPAESPEGWTKLQHPDLSYGRQEPTIEAAIKVAGELQAKYDRRDQIAAAERALAPTVPDAAAPPLIRPATCTRCGKESTEITYYQAGLVPEYPGRAVILCRRCVPELLHARAELAAAQPSAPDPRTQIAALLKALTPLIEGLKTDDFESLSQAISDLNECIEGTEWEHWLKVGYALLDLEMEA